MPQTAFSPVRGGLVSVEEEIVPARARELLDVVARHPEISQRKTSRRKVAQYVRDMRKGDWGLSDSAIVLVTADNGDEVVVNGIHRLTAVMHANCVVRSMVIHGANITDRKYYDSGFERTVKQSMVMEYDIDNAATKVAVFRALMLLVNGSPKDDISKSEMAYKLKRDTLVKAFDALHGIRKSCKTPSTDSKSIRSDVALAVFVFAYHQDPDKVKQLYLQYLKLDCKSSGATQPLFKIADLVRQRSMTVNIASGSGRLPFMQKAVVLLRSAIAGKECKKTLDLAQETTMDLVADAIAEFMGPWAVVLTPDQPTDSIDPGDVN